MSFERMPTPQPQPEIAESMKEGMALVIERIHERLTKEDVKRPMMVFINGQAGAGKSTTSPIIREQLNQEGFKAIFLETDNYGEQEFYPKSYLAEQQAAWEAGQPFKYYNSEIGQEDMAPAELDVVIMGGIDAIPRNTTEDRENLRVFIARPILDRLARKGYRDFIRNARPQPNPEIFIDEICQAPEDPDDDLLLHLLRQEHQGKKFRESADIVIKNPITANTPKMEISGDMLYFRADHEGTEYRLNHEIPPERIQLIQEIASVQGDGL